MSRPTTPAGGGPDAACLSSNDIVFFKFSGGKTPGIDEEARAAKVREGVHSGQKKSISPGSGGNRIVRTRLTISACAARSS